MRAVPLTRNAAIAGDRWLDRLPMIVVVLLTIGLLATLGPALSPDISGQLWIARAMRRGGRLYTDIVELNPPLWFWMAIPVDALGEALGLRSERVIIGVVGGLVLAVVAAIHRLGRASPSIPLALFCSYVALILLVMPARNLEQREHLVLIGAVPWLMLAAARRTGTVVSPWLAIGIGIAAGLGFALKPYFLGVPVLVEAWLIISLRRAWRPLRAETVALAATGLLYGAAIGFVTPHYLATISRLSGFYADFGTTLWGATGFIQIVWAVFLLVIVSQWRVLAKAPLTVAFTLGAIGFALSWGVQHKGWLYHGLPTTGCLALALAALIMEAGPAIGTRLRLFVPAMLLWPLSFALIDTEPAVAPDNDIGAAMTHLRAGDALGLISSIGATSWPSLVGRDLRLSSRFTQYWMLAALRARPNDPDVAAYGREVVRQTAFDYRCGPPKVIVFVRFSRQPGASAMDDPYAYFMREPDFAQVMQHYRRARTSGDYEAWVPASPLPLVDRRLCRRS